MLGYLWVAKQLRGKLSYADKLVHGHIFLYLIWFWLTRVSRFPPFLLIGQYFAYKSEYTSWQTAKNMQKITGNIAGNITGTNNRNKNNDKEQTISYNN